MRREDKFDGLVGDSAGGFVDYGAGPVAQFEHAFPCISTVKGYDGRSYSVIDTHFRLNLDNVRLRIENLKLPINYGKVPWSMVNEQAAEQAILSVMQA